MKVFRTACIMLDLSTPSRIDGYIDLIKSYVVRYGAACCYLIYQADVRMRLEQAERIRRRGEIETSAHIDEATKFDPKKLWEWVWMQIPTT